MCLDQSNHYLRHDLKESPGFSTLKCTAEEHRDQVGARQVIFNRNDSRDLKVGHILGKFQG